MDKKIKKNNPNEFSEFPGYKPKNTPDTIRDYLKGETKVFEILDKIGPKSLNNIKKIIKNFKLYKRKALENPGTFKRGHPGLGANVSQYFPSEEELIVSELGTWLINLLSSLDDESMIPFKKEQDLKSERLQFNKIYFRNVDVMGFGRYFYAEKEEKKTLVII